MFGGSEEAWGACVPHLGGTPEPLLPPHPPGSPVPSSEVTEDHMGIKMDGTSRLFRPPHLHCSLLFLTKIPNVKRDTWIQNQTGELKNKGSKKRNFLPPPGLP